MSLPTVNYVIAACCEERHGGTTSVDATMHLTQHLAMLQRVPHHLKQITIMLSSRSRESAAGPHDPVVLPAMLLDVLIELQRALPATTVEVIPRSNYGFAYGAFCEANFLAPGFDYYILNEDDYVFVKPDFDQWLVESLDLAGADMLCGRVLPDPEDPEHSCPGVFVGIMTEGALDRVATSDRIGKRWPLGADYGQACVLQRLWARELALVDWAKQHPCAYWNTAQGVLRWYGPASGLSPVAPLQAMYLDQPLAFDNAAPAGARGRVTVRGKLEVAQ